MIETNSDFHYFHNDYIEWFQTYELNSKFYNSAFNEIYEFDEFKAEKLAEIPDFTPNNKTNNKLCVYDGKIIVSNSTNIL